MTSNSTNPNTNNEERNTNNEERIAGQAEQTIKYNQSATEKQESAKTTNQPKDFVQNNNSKTRQSIKRQDDSSEKSADTSSDSELSSETIDFITDDLVEGKHCRINDQFDKPDKKKINSDKKIRKQELNRLLKIMSQVPVITRDFFILLKKSSDEKLFNDEEFRYYAAHGFRSYQKIIKTAWICRGAIAFECRERNWHLKSKGGRGSKGAGLAAEIEKVAAALGIASSTLNDDVSIYIAFVEDLVPVDVDEEARQSKRSELMEGINLERYFYLRALPAREQQYEAVEMARRKLYETGGEYTEAEFIKDVNRLRHPKTSDEQNENGDQTMPGDFVVEKINEDAKIEFTCQVNSKLFDYLQEIAGKWKVSIGQGIEFLIESHFRSSNPTREVKS